MALFVPRSRCVLLVEETLGTRCRMKTTMIVATAMFWVPLHARAGDPTPEADRGSAVFTVGISGMASFQPGGYESSGSPYLSKNLGGLRPGVGLSFERHRRGQPLVTLEVGTTQPFEAVQEGRFVRRSSTAMCSPFGGSCRATGRHRDTLLSLLTGWRNGPVALKAGPTVVFGQTSQGEARYDDAAGRFGLTAGLDGIIPVGRRMDVIPSARYTYVFRGPSGFYVGLGSHILRLAVGLRLQVNTPTARPARRP